MIKSQVLRGKVEKIAILFCETDIDCINRTKERVINNLTDELFQFGVLPYINKSRFAIIKMKTGLGRKKPCPAVIPGSRGYKHKFKITDLFTGFFYNSYTDCTSENLPDPQYFIPKILNFGKLKLLGQIGNYEYIVKISNVPLYGINYVHQVIQPNPVPRPIAPPVLIEPIKPGELMAGFNLESIKENPKIVIGGAALLFFFLMS